MTWVPGSLVVQVHCIGNPDLVVVVPDILAVGSLGSGLALGILVGGRLGFEVALGILVAGSLGSGVALGILVAGTLDWVLVPGN